MSYHPDEDSDRLDYASTLVSPEAYIVVCPSCNYRHEVESMLTYRCPACNKAIAVDI